MQNPRKHTEIQFSEQERSYLIRVFPQFLSMIEYQGATSTELQVLLGILQLLRESNRADKVLEELLTRVTNLVETVVPDQLTLKEAAQFFEVNADTLRRVCWMGKLQAEKHGKTWLVKRSDLEQYLANNPRIRSS